MRKLLVQRKLTFGKKLIRLHFVNAIFFTVLTVTGFILYSSFFRANVPTARVWIKDGHVIQ